MIESTSDSSSNSLAISAKTGVTALGALAFFSLGFAAAFAFLAAGAFFAGAAFLVATFLAAFL